MGITIHYQGRLQDPATLSLFVPKLQLACQRLDWSYEVIDERILGTAEYFIDLKNFSIATKPVDDRWQGLLIRPPECETLWLTFNRSGQLIVYDPPFEEPDTPGRYHARYHLWCKTQFGAIDTHIEICGLLRLVEPYMAEFEVIDEGDYWDSKDRKQLAAKLGQINQMIDLLAGEIETDDVEIGKRLEQPMSSWRQSDRGLSAHEN